MNDRDKARDRVRKLRAKAGSTTFPAEADALLAKASEIEQIHGIAGPKARGVDDLLATWARRGRAPFVHAFADSDVQLQAMREAVRRITAPPQRMATDTRSRVTGHVVVTVYGWNGQGNPPTTRTYSTDAFVT